MVSPLSPKDDSSPVSLPSTQSNASKVAGHSWSNVFSRNLSYMVARVIRMFSRLVGAKPAVESTVIRAQVILLNKPDDVAQKVAQLFDDLQNRPYDISAKEAKEIRKAAVQKLVEAKDPKALVDLLKGSSDKDEKALWKEAYDQVLSAYKEKPDPTSYALLMENAGLRYGDEATRVVQELLKGKLDALSSEKESVFLRRENKQVVFGRLEGSKESFHQEWGRLIGVFYKAQNEAEAAKKTAVDQAAAVANFTKAEANLKAIQAGYKEITGRDARLPRMVMDLARLSSQLHGNKLWDEADAFNDLANQAQKPHADVKTLVKAWQKTVADIMRKGPPMPEELKALLEESYKKFI